MKKVIIIYLLSLLAIFMISCNQKSTIENNKTISITIIDNEKVYDAKIIENDNQYSVCLDGIENSYTNFYYDEKYLIPYNGEELKEGDSLYIKRDNEIIINVFYKNYYSAIYKIKKGESFDVNCTRGLGTYEHAIFECFYDEDLTMPYNGELLFGDTLFYSKIKFDDRHLRYVLDGVEYNDYQCKETISMFIEDIPVHNGYYYLGIYYDSDYTVPYNGEQLNENDLLYIKFDREIINVQYEIEGILYTVQIKNNYIDISLLEHPDNIIINNIYLDANHTQKYNLEKLTCNSFIYLDYTIIKPITITYICGDESIEIHNVNKGSINCLPNKYRYSGLYYDNEYTIPYDDIELYKDTTLYVKEKELVWVSFYNNKSLIMKKGFEKGAILSNDLIYRGVNNEYVSAYTDKEYKNSANNLRLNNDINIYLKFDLSPKIKDKDKYGTRSFQSYLGNYSVVLTVHCGKDITKVFCLVGKKYDINDLYLDEECTIPLKNYYVYTDLHVYAKDLSFATRPYATICYDSEILGYYYILNENNNYKDLKLSLFDYLSESYIENENNIVYNLKEKITTHYINIVFNNNVYGLTIEDGTSLTNNDIATVTGCNNFIINTNNNLIELNNIKNNAVLNVEPTNDYLVDNNKNSFELIYDYLYNNNEYGKFEQYCQATTYYPKALYETPIYDKYYLIVDYAIKEYTFNSLDDLYVIIGFGYFGNMDKDNLRVDISYDNNYDVDETILSINNFNNDMYPLSYYYTPYNSSSIGSFSYAVETKTKIKLYLKNYLEISDSITIKIYLGNDLYYSKQVSISNLDNQICIK